MGTGPLANSSGISVKSLGARAGANCDFNPIALSKYQNLTDALAAEARAMIKTNDAKRKPTKLCLAKTRSGVPCQKHPIAGRTRCRLHGGLSTGPRSPEGKAACVAAHWKHGRRSKAFVETSKRIWADLRRVERALKASGLID